VIASAPTDNTCEKVREFAKKDKRVQLILQKKREGKASAVNIFLRKAKNNIVVLLGGDLILEKHTIERLVSVFADKNLGMTGGHPIPLNNIEDGLMGFAAHMLWDLHHRIALKKPKMGEVIAFRKVFKKIPVLSSVDEANIEPLIRGQGYTIRYIAQAKIYNKAPATVSDFIKQRRRIYSGHLAVKNEQSYEVSTMGSLSILTALSSFLHEKKRPKYFIYTPIVMSLEVLSRYLGWWDYSIKKKRHTVWEVVTSTKEL
jgi:cellulose synthase/poly-beta-1,6-N-acetylglucosamine synthase-like glycosyltransferase